MEGLIFVCLILFAIVLIMWREYVGNRQFLKNKLAQIYEGYGVLPERTYGAEELVRISMYYQKHQRADQIDDITWNDLNLDAVYQRLNTCLSAAGDEYLYYRLRTPAQNADELSRMEERIRFFMEQDRKSTRLNSSH